MAGSVVHTLVLADVATGWTECLPLIARDQAQIVEAMSEFGKRCRFRCVGSTRTMMALLLIKQCSAIASKQGWSSRARALIERTIKHGRIEEWRRRSQAGWIRSALRDRGCRETRSTLRVLTLLCELLSAFCGFRRCEYSFRPYLLFPSISARNPHSHRPGTIIHMLRNPQLPGSTRPLSR
jgi:hypothetical protein